MMLGFKSVRTSRANHVLLEQINFPNAAAIVCNCEFELIICRVNTVHILSHTNLLLLLIYFHFVFGFARARNLHEMHGMHGHVAITRVDQAPV